MATSVLVGMSGGIDSTAVVLYLQQQGYDVKGSTLSLLGRFAKSTAAEEARALADSLRVPHTVVDGASDFEKNVTDAFASSYLDGNTPNPCVLCNRTVKFPLLLKEADRLGCEKIATGHYARLQFDSATGRTLICRAADRSKDQTYMLYGLSQDILRRTVFPLGDKLKTDIRAFASAHALPNAGKHDSQDICFIPDGDYAAFLTSHYGVKDVPGHFTDMQGNVLGSHTGAFRFTVGQRKGFGMGFGKRVYVIDKDALTGDVRLGDDADLFTDRASAKEMHFIPFDTLTSPMRVTAKTRYSQTETPATVYPTSENTVDVVFDTPVRAVTPGQSLVLYDGDIMLGGGILEGKKK